MINKFLIFTLIQCILVSFVCVQSVQSQCYDDESGFFPDDTQCDKYIECNNGKLVNVSLW